jgi:hypothetical protein
MRYGIGAARRGWLGPERIVNTASLKKMEKIIGK